MKKIDENTYRLFRKDIIKLLRTSGLPLPELDETETNVVAVNNAEEYEDDNGYYLGDDKDDFHLVVEIKGSENQEEEISW